MGKLLLTLFSLFKLQYRLHTKYDNLNGSGRVKNTVSNLEAKVRK